MNLEGFDYSSIDGEQDDIYRFTRTINEAKDTSNLVLVKKPCQARKSRYSKSPRKASSTGRKEQRRHIIQHDYHDHAEDILYGEQNDDDSVKKSTASFTSQSKKKKGGVTIPFPMKLHELLEYADKENLNHIISWQPHGRAFVVRDPRRFVSEVMPKFFRQTKLTSFQRQLNLYGFSRLTRGPDGGGYYHELFLRGRPLLTNNMIRTKIKGTGYKAASNPLHEPDFYKMPLVVLPSTSTDNGEVRALESPTQITDDAVHTKITCNFSSEAAIVTPDAGGADNFTSQRSPFYDFDFDPPLSNSIDESRQVPQQPLQIRPSHKVVKIGNKSFQYMESVNPFSHVAGEGDVACWDGPLRSEDDDCSEMSVEMSPLSYDHDHDFYNPSRDSISLQDPLDLLIQEWDEDTKIESDLGCLTEQADV